MPAISPPGASSSLWVNVPMPTPVVQRPRPQQQQPAQPPMMPQVKSWVPPPLTLLPHVDTEDPRQSPYGPRGPGQFARDFYARFGNDIGQSPWIPEGQIPDIMLINAHQLANEFYDNPNPDTLKEYQKAAEQAQPRFDNPAGIKREMRFLRLMGSSFEKGRKVDPEHIAILHDLHQDAGQTPELLYKFGQFIRSRHNDPLARKVADWAEIHARIAMAIRDRKRMPPGLVGKQQQTRAYDTSSPAWGPHSFTTDETAQARDRFLTHFATDPIPAALDVAREANAREGKSPRQGLPNLDDPKYRARLKQMMRSGRPIRYSFSRHEILPVAHGVAEKPHDSGRWAALSDLMQENGKQAIGEAMLPLVFNGDRHFYPDFRFGNGPIQKEGSMRSDPVGHHALRDTISEMPIYGHAHGLRLTLHPVSGIGHNGKLTDSYVLHIHAPDGSNRVNSVMGITTLGRKQATEVLREMEPFPENDGSHAAWLDLLDRFTPDVDLTGARFFFENRWPPAAPRSYTQLPPLGPDRHSRGRLTRYGLEDVQGLHRALSSEPWDHNGQMVGGRLDRGIWAVLSDALRDLGKDGSADLMQSLGQGEVVSYPNRKTMFFDPSQKMRKTTVMLWPESFPLKVAGIPIYVTRWHGKDWVNGRAVPGPAVFHASVYPPVGPDGSGTLGSAVIEPQHLQALIREADEVGNSVTPNLPAWPELQQLPEQYSAWRAPTGGMITRGIYQPGGQFLPVEAVGGWPKQGKIRELLARWKQRRRTNYARDFDNHHSWIDPSGNFYPVPSHIGHGVWAEQQGLGGEQQLLRQGWHRVFPYGQSQLGTHNEWVPPNGRQRSALADLAMMTGIKDVTHIGPYPSEPRTIWSSADQFARINYAAELRGGLGERQGFTDTTGLGALAAKLIANKRKGQRAMPAWVPREDPNAVDPSLTGFAPVTSSWIQDLKYKPGAGTSMRVKKTGKEYPYPGLNLAMFRSWLASKSPGKWWWRHIGWPMRGQTAPAVP